MPVLPDGIGDRPIRGNGSPIGDSGRPIGGSGSPMLGWPIETGAPDGLCCANTLAGRIVAKTTAATTRICAHYTPVAHHECGHMSAHALSPAVS